jgi:hypothetical protein
LTMRKKPSPRRASLWGFEAIQVYISLGEVSQSVGDLCCDRIIKPRKLGSPSWGGGSARIAMKFKRVGFDAEWIYSKS